ncbi:3',5'-cyclic-nucleotide phosphodiesterase [Weeksellaceae bacterium A-14]
MKKHLLFLLLLFSFWIPAQDFRIIPLGVQGGATESNLSAYLITEGKSENYLALDAGTLYSGIDFYLRRKQWAEDPANFLKHNIKGYFLSHPHFDHISGLIVNSPEDTLKNIYLSAYTAEVLQKHVFMWETWANFADTGDQPALAKYHYRILEPQKWLPAEGTTLQMKIFPLSHVGAGKSSAVLLRNSQDRYFLYLGDTGADEIEKTSELKSLWDEIIPLIREGSLKAIAIECSYADGQPSEKLFGHMKPELLIKELAYLAKQSGKKDLNGVKIIITHIKPKKNVEQQIMNELLPARENISVQLAEQGIEIEL